MKSIHPSLWFDKDAEEAMDFYTSVFKNSKKGKVTRYGDNMPLPKGTVITASFTLNGLDFLAINGGPMFKFSPAISMVANCETQDEVDHLWDKLSEGGEKQQCGWLKDKYGMSWQVVPTALGELMGAADAAGSGRIMSAVMRMKKLDIATLQKAAKGELAA